MTTPLNGLVGGALAALLAAAAAGLVGDGSSPTAPASGTAFGDRLRALGWRGLALQVAYGSAAGGALVAFELFVGGGLGVPPTAVEAFSATLVWSAVLFGLATALRRFGVRTPVDRSLRGRLAYYLVYGVGLGVWIRLTWIT